MDAFVVFQSANLYKVRSASRVPALGELCNKYFQHGGYGTSRTISIC